MVTATPHHNCERPHRPQLLLPDCDVPCPQVCCSRSRLSEKMLQKTLKSKNSPAKPPAEAIVLFSFARLRLRYSLPAIPSLIFQVAVMMLNRYLTLVFLAALLTNQGWAQVELFGPDQEAVVETTEQAPAPLSDDDPLLKNLLEQAGRGNLQLAASINSLARLERWNEADQLLRAIPGKQLDETTLASIFLTIGPANYLRLKQPNLLSDEALKSLDALQAAALNYSQSSGRLTQAIENLIAEDEDTKLEATRILLSGGDASIQAIVAACCQSQPSVKLNRMLSTLVALGGGGVSAVRQIALYGTPEHRVNAMESLARINLEKHIVDIATAAHAQDSNQEERVAAEKLLEKSGSFPSRGETLQALTLDFNRLLSLARQQQRDGRIQKSWAINETRDGVVPQATPVYLATFRDVYDAAARLQRFGQLTGEVEAESILQSIGYQIMADPDWGDDSQIKEVANRFSDLNNAAEISSILGIALQTEEIPGAIGIVRLISALTWSDEQVKEFLRGSAGAPSPLARAAVSSNAQLRYESAKAISQLSSSSSYPGVSQVRRTLSEMTRLEEQPIAILIETRPEVTLVYEGLLTEMGFAVKRATSVAQAQRLVDQGGDLRVILAKQQLFDRTAIELIDTVRRTHRGRTVPIAIFGEDEISLGAQRWQAPTQFLYEPVTQSALGELISQAEQQSFVPPLSETDRIQFRDQATSLLK